MKELKLSKGMVALVDDRDFKFLSQWKWYAHTNNRGKIYYAARRTKKSDNRKSKKICMHREILNPSGSSIQVDHRDGNGLNNQRCNLRVCTNQQNLMNRGSNIGSISRYKGVTWCKAAKKWQAQIKIDSKNHYLGRFTDEIDAAMAYDRKAVEVFDNFAYLNFNQ